MFRIRESNNGKKTNNNEKSKNEIKIGEKPPKQNKYKKIEKKAIKIKKRKKN